LKIPCYLNIAACKLKIGDYQDVIKNCDDVLKVQPDNIKALFRKGQALNTLDVWDEAKQLLSRALELDPQNTDAKKELALLKQKRRQQDQKDSKIFGGLFERMSKDEPTATTTSTPLPETKTTLPETKTTQPADVETK